MKTLKFLGAAVLPLLMFAGCKGGGSGGPATADDFCTQYADAVCQIATSCGITMTTCTAYQKSQCEALATTSTAAPGKRVFTPANTGGCISKLNAAYGASAPLITPAIQAGIDLACGYVFQGKGMVDMDTCTTQFDCAGATNGSIICDQAHHLCATSKTISGTSQCNDNGAVCATNSYCAANSSGISSCMPEGTSNPPSSCSATVPCDSNSYCANGTCMPLLVAGTPCVASSECASGGFCDPYGGSATCDDGIRFAKGSQQCTCVASGLNCPTPPGSGGQSGGAAGSSGAAGNGAAGSPGAAGGAGAAGVSGSAGAAGGHAGTGGGAVSDNG